MPFSIFNISVSLIPVAELNFFKDNPEDSLLDFINWPKLGILSPLVKVYHARCLMSMKKLTKYFQKAAKI